MTLTPKTIVAAILIAGFVATAEASEPSQVFFAFDDHAIPWHHNTKVTLVDLDRGGAVSCVSTSPYAVRCVVPAGSSGFPGPQRREGGPG